MLHLISSRLKHGGWSSHSSERQHPEYALHSEQEFQFLRHTFQKKKKNYVCAKLHCKTHVVWTKRRLSFSKARPSIIETTATWNSNSSVNAQFHYTSSDHTYKRGGRFKQNGQHPVHKPVSMLACSHMSLWASLKGAIPLLFVKGDRKRRKFTCVQ